MGSGSGAKAWAMVLMTVMVLSAFGGLASLGGEPDKLITGLEYVSFDIIGNDFFRSGAKQPVNENILNKNKLNERNTGPARLSPPPGPETEGTWTYDFDSDTVGQWPSDPPWVLGLEPGQVSTFPTDDFENDTVGSTPDMPPWISTDGSSPTVYWFRDYEDLLPDGSPIPQDYHDGAGGYFFSIAGSLTAEAPPAGGVPGTVYPGFSTGAVCAKFTDDMAGTHQYYGSIGIGEDLTTNAYCGGWIYVTTDYQFDLIIGDTAGGGDAAITLLDGAGGLMYYNGVFNAIAGPSYLPNEWHEWFIEYDDVAQTWSLWWDGVEYIPGTPYYQPTCLNVNYMLWYAFGFGDYYIDNFYHFEPSSGLPHRVQVTNAQAQSGTQSVWIDQENVAAPNLASTSTTFGIPMAGTGTWDYWFRTDTAIADTNGAVAEILDQSDNGVIQIQANAGNFEYNDGGAWTVAQAFAADTWYQFTINFDTVAKSYTLDIDSNPVGAAAFARESGTLTTARYRGTDGTQSEHYIDDVYLTCSGASTNISISDLTYHSSPNALRFQEYNSVSGGYIGGDNFGAGGGSIGTFSFWFYNTDNGGGQYWNLMDQYGGQTMTIISLGVDIGWLTPIPGQVQFVNNDGAGLWPVDGPIYNTSEWHQLTIEYNCSDYGVSGSTGSYYYSWDSGAQVGPFGMIDPVNYLDALICSGGAPNTYGDFFYDDFSLGVNTIPVAPTNSWAEHEDPGPGTSTIQITVADLSGGADVIGPHTLTHPPADAPPDTNAQQITEVTAKKASPGPIDLSPGPGPQPTAQVYYVTRTAFDNDAGPLPIEDWEASNAAPGTINGMDAPLDEFTNNAYFSPGDVLPGIRIQDNPGPDTNGLVALGVGGGGCPTLTVSTNTFADSCDIWFDDPAYPVYAIGMDVQTYLAAGTVDIEIYGVGGVLLDTVSTPGDNTGIFWGVISDEQIEHINMYEQTGGTVECGDNIAFGDPLQGMTLNHQWQLEDMPVNSISRTLNITARTNTGSGDNFDFSWALTPFGPWTDTLTVNSDAYTPYSASIPPSFNGPLYLRVADDNPRDVIADTVYVDCIYIESMVSTASTNVTVHWDLSADDGAGENDIVQYNVYRADEEHGDTIAGPYMYLGSSPPGSTTYNDIGEAGDQVNQAWYYVEAEDSSGQTNSSGYFSKLNFPPVTGNVMANGEGPRLVIPPGTTTVTLTADAYDDSSQYEAIPKMNYSEYYIDVDPGEGYGTEIQPADSIWDTMTEPLQGTVDTSGWGVGEVHDIWVRTAEDHNGTWVFGAAANVTVEVTDGQPIANAGPDQWVTQHTLVSFDGSLSTDDVGITNYWWNFTDGANQSLTGVAPTYTFDNEGIYTVTLTVMDTIGQTDNDTMIVNVTDGDPPVADAGPDQQVMHGDMVFFDGSGSYDPGHLGEPIIDGIVNWTWTFDDGTGPQTIWGVNPMHQFNIPGVYTVTLTVSDNAPTPPAAAPFTDADIMIVTVVDIFDLDISIAAISNDWIMMSFPNKISGHPFTVIVDALDEGGGFVEWDIIRGWDNKNKTWMTSAKFWPPSLNTFNYVDNTMGFWLHISDYGDGILTFVGPMAAPGEQVIISLYAGWNLVGYPFPVPQEMFYTFGTMFTLDSDVETYDAFSPPYYLRVVDIGTEWHEPGLAYWVHMIMDEDLWMWCP